MQKKLGKILYGSLFMVVLPALLIAWAKLTNNIILLPVPENKILIFTAIVIGSIFFIGGMHNLWHFGKGLPMNAYPPKFFVRNGVYAICKNPIYFGTVLLSFGISAYLNSSSGFWLISPLLILMVIAYTLGFENEKTEKHFGPQTFKPFLSLSEDSEKSLTNKEIFSTFFTVFIPCLLVYGAIIFLGLEKNVFYFLPYTLIICVPFILKTEKQLRNFSINSLLFTVTSALIYFIAPFPSIRFMISAFLGYMLVSNKILIWDSLRSTSETVANSWKEWNFGQVRVINHAFYAGIATFLGALIASSFFGEANAPAAFIIGFCSILGAALWAQSIEGSPSMLRPFGYYGGILGAILGSFFVSIYFKLDINTVLAATTISAPWVQIFGRFRCLVQGCCHGKSVESRFSWLGIRFTHPLSRVNKISHLQNKLLHPTQIYSIITNLIISGILFKLFFLKMPTTFLIGIYLILNSLSRFVEESLRGEAQTPYWMGMRIYQWIAILFTFVGIVFTSISSAPLLSLEPNFYSFIWAVALGLFATFAYGIDFPKSNKPFARLTSN